MNGKYTLHTNNKNTMQQKVRTAVYSSTTTVEIEILVTKSVLKIQG
jgi:hypothetical protein